MDDLVVGDRSTSGSTNPVQRSTLIPSNHSRILLAIYVAEYVMQLLIEHVVRVWRSNRHFATISTACVIGSLYYTFLMSFFLHTFYRLSRKHSESMSSKDEINWHSTENNKRQSYRLPVLLIVFDTFSAIFGALYYIAQQTGIPSLNLFCVPEMNHSLSSFRPRFIPPILLILGNLIRSTVNVFILSSLIILIGSALGTIRFLIHAEKIQDHPVDIGIGEQSEQLESKKLRRRRRQRLMYWAAVVMGFLVFAGIVIWTNWYDRYPLDLLDSKKYYLPESRFDFISHAPDRFVARHCLRRQDRIHIQQKGQQQSTLERLIQKRRQRMTAWLTSNVRRTPRRRTNICRFDNSRTAYFINGHITAAAVLFLVTLVLIMLLRRNLKLVARRHSNNLNLSQQQPNRQRRKTNQQQIIVWSLIVESSVCCLLPMAHVAHRWDPTSFPHGHLFTALEIIFTVLQLLVTPAVSFLLSKSFRTEHFRTHPSWYPRNEKAQIISGVICIYAVGLLLVVYLPFRLIYYRWDIDTSSGH